MILDLILCAVIVITAVAAYKRGALSSVRGIASYAGAAYLTYTFSETVSAYIYDHFVRNIIIERIKKAIFDGSAYDKDYAYHSYVKEAAGVSKKTSDVAEYITDKYLSAVAEPVSQMITSAVMFILASFLIALILRLIIHAVRGRRKGAARAADSFVGLVIGLAEGAIIAGAAACILSMTDSSIFSGISDQVADQIKNSRLVEFAGTILIPMLREHIPTRL